jgi:LysM repeat protein
MGMDIGVPQVSPRYDDNSGSAPSASNSSANVSAPIAGSATSGSHDTKVFGNLEGRDPDLLFAGEKIMINGKQVTVADGDTLSSLAAKHGTTVEKLISENKMDASLLGKNGPSGAYFTPGGPQPANGGSTTPPPNATTNTAPVSNTTAPNNTPAASNTTPAPNDNSRLASLVPDPNVQAQAQGSLNKGGEPTFKLIGGRIHQDRASNILKEINSGNTGGLSETELENLKIVLQEAPGLGNGFNLPQGAKDLFNKYMMGAKGPLALNPEPTTSPSVLPA